MDIQMLTALAEGEGFEPPVSKKPTTVFKTAALNHSAIPPFVKGANTVGEYSKG